MDVRGAWHEGVGGIFKGGGDNPMHTMLSYGWLQDSLQDPEQPKCAAVDFL